MLNDENVALPELPLFDSVGLSNIVVSIDEVESFLKALPIGNLQAQIKSTIVFSENWLMSSYLLYVLYLTNP